MSDWPPSLIDVIVHELSRTDARRIAVRGQLLDSTRPSDLAETVLRLTLLQNDLTVAVAPSAEPMAWSRLGSSSPRNAVTDAVAAQSLIDLHGMLRPAEDLVLYGAEIADWARGRRVPALGRRPRRSGYEPATASGVICSTS